MLPELKTKHSLNSHNIGVYNRGRNIVNHKIGLLKLKSNNT